MDLGLWEKGQGNIQTTSDVFMRVWLLVRLESSPRIWISSGPETLTTWSWRNPLAGKLKGPTHAPAFSGSHICPMTHVEGGFVPNPTAPPTSYLATPLTDSLVSTSLASANCPTENWVHRFTRVEGQNFRAWFKFPSWMGLILVLSLCPFPPPRTLLMASGLQPDFALIPYMTRWEAPRPRESGPSHTTHGR